MKFNSVLDSLKNYEAGKPIELVVREYGIESKDVVKLASNENPRGCAPRVLKAIVEEASRASLYPDDSMYELKEGLAKRFGVLSKNIIIGSGSDQVIEFALHAKANPQSAILVAGVTFAMYEIYAKHTGAKVYKTPSQQHNLDEFRAILKEHKDIGVVFLCIPNNPLGECLDADEVKKFIAEVPKDTLVIVDGAYNEYASYKDKNKAICPKELIEEFENVLFLGTFSKAYGLGGMRCGYGVAREEIIGALGKIRPPFNITTLSLKAGIEALKDEDFVSTCIKENFEQMERYEEVAKQMGFDFIPSYTNFITLKFPDGKSASKIAQTLLEKGIIIRDLSSYGLNAIRVTIGTPEQNNRFFEVFKSVYN